MFPGYRVPLCTPRGFDFMQKQVLRHSPACQDYPLEESGEGLVREACSAESDDMITIALTGGGLQTGNDDTR